MPDRDELESPTVPIIACTGRAEGHDFLDVAKLLGAQRTIANPFPITESADAVEQELQRNLRPQRESTGHHDKTTGSSIAEGLGLQEQPSVRT